MLIPVGPPPFLISSFPNVTDVVLALHVHPSGKYLISAGHALDNRIILWQLRPSGASESAEVKADSLDPEPAEGF